MKFRVILEYDAEAQSHSAVYAELPGCTGDAKVRMISARKATRREARQYKDVER